MASLANHYAQTHANTGNARHDVFLVTQAGINEDRYRLHPDITRLTLNAGKPSANIWQALKGNVQRAWRLRNVLKRLRADVLLTFMPTANVLGLLTSIGLGQRVIVSERLHPAHLGLSSIRKTMQALLYPRAQNVVVLSEVSRAYLQKHMSLSNLVVIPNGVELPLADLPPRFDIHDYLQPGERAALFVGRMTEQKQPQQALQAFAAATASAPEPWRLLMLGDGPESQYVEDQINTLHLHDRVTRLPRVGNLQAWYEAADIFLSTSLYEGSPNALLEAMACGCATLAYDCETGPGDIIQNGDNGELVAVGDVDAFTRRLTVLVQDEAYRQRLGEAARGVNETFSQRRFLEAWDALIKSEG